MRRRWTGTVAGGFTLVELLVVIGIIALLLSILLPALAGARRVAQRTACAAKLNQIMLAAELHRQEHHGFYPLAGEVPSRAPENLSDADAVKYDYLSLARGRGMFDRHFQARKLAALPDSLSVYMGFKQQILDESNSDMVDHMYDTSGFLRNFLCPSQATTSGELAQALNASIAALIYPDDGLGGGYQEPQSYMYNEAILGWAANQTDPTQPDRYYRLHARSGGIRQPSVTMFAADGLAGQARTDLGGLAGPELYNLTTTPTPVTLADAYTGAIDPTLGTPKAGDPGCFDKVRHAGKINVAFCDGHVESRDITAGELAKIYLVAP